MRSQLCLSCRTQVCVITVGQYINRTIQMKSSSFHSLPLFIARCSMSHSPFESKCVCVSKCVNTLCCVTSIPRPVVELRVGGMVCATLKRHHHFAWWENINREQRLFLRPLTLVNIPACLQCPKTTPRLQQVSCRELGWNRIHVCTKISAEEASCNV